ncbi:50S ribosomal protein L12 [Eremomyces bilateralis CBS 781.70]|uniref:50S ribosomal protein L12 n=1 Tax=Eremomyces bilateralis CBS 781.70 TaxID=1392243 RepID=A0A6G1G488_9PEZI|nr:50S ribosomal protein L12 [Eremomyces bilateralis CBS 781.70]KAF1812639.1 50S ribosomal protein L12 [Eremomyces bilateralis CBS 781.70]
MSLSLPAVVRQCARSPLRRRIISTSVLRQRTTQSASYLQRRQQSTEAAAPLDPKIEAIVEQIGKLTLLETADLVSTLKSRLNIPDVPMGGFAAAAPAAAAPVEEEEAAPPAQEKTLFNLKLQSFDAGSKPKVIKEIKSLLGLSLVDSKKFVESAPKMMKESVPKEEGEKIVETLKAIGAVVVME